jgi:hypothetical protein
MEFGGRRSPYGSTTLSRTTMRRTAFLLFVLAAAWMAGDHPTAFQQNASDPCPLKWRKDPAAAAPAREAKKQRMRANGVPQRYLHLLDKMECVACIETAPDTLHITVLYNDDEHAPTLSTGERDLKVEFKWSPQGERQLREELRNGQIQAFYVWIHEKRCYCCPDFDQRAEDDQDWNGDTGLNMDEAQAFDDPADLGPLPDDLKPPPPGSQIPPPPIERFDDLPRPSRRVLQATCQACEGLASQWTNESNNLNFLWDRKIEQMRRVSVIANARANRSNEIERLEYEQRFDSTRSYDNLQKIKELKEVNEAQEADQDRAEREIERLDEQIRDTEMRMEELMQKFLECEKTCKKTTATGAAGTTGAVATDALPVTADASPAATQNPPQGAPVSQEATAACPDCTAHAQRIGDLQTAVRSHQAEVVRLQEAVGRNASNLNNLTQLRAEAAAKGDAARVAELEGRIQDLQNANRGHRAEQFKHNEEITALTEQIEAAQRDLAACNSQCGAKGLVPGTGLSGTTGGTGNRTAPKREVAVDPLPPLPDCKECEPLVKQLRAEHERLRDMAERANQQQRDSDIEDAEEQRAKVEALKQELEKCKCPTTTTASGTGVNTTGTGPGAAGTPATNISGTTGVPANTPVTTGGNAQAACPDCTAHAQRIGDLQTTVRSHQAEVVRLQEAIGRNAANLNNLTQLRADAAARGDAGRVAELEGRIQNLQNSNRGHRAEQFKHNEEITALTEQIEAAERDLAACNSQCAAKGLVPGTSLTGATGVSGTRAAPKREVAVDPLPPLPDCKECEPLVKELRTEHARLREMAERANQQQRDSDIEDAEEQRAKVEALKQALQKCRCGTTTDSAPVNTTGAAPSSTPPSALSTPAPQTAGITPGGQPVVGSPSITIDGRPNHSGDMYAETREARAACPECQSIVDEAGKLNQQRRQAWAEHQRLQSQFEAMGSDLRAEDEAFRAATKRGDAAAATELRGRMAETIRRRTDVNTAAQAQLKIVDDLNSQIDFVLANLEGCNRSCKQPTTSDSANCVGAACGTDWSACSATNSCAPIDTDCGVPGTCTAAGDPASSPFNLLDPSAWSTTANADVETRIQIKIGDVVFDVAVRPYQAPRVENWLNPLGLLARRVTANFERWRGGLGPRPLIDPRDVSLVEKFTSGQGAGLAKGLHVLLTDRGGSTGKTLSMQVLNLTGREVRLGAMPFAIEPIRQQAQQRVQQAFNRLAQAAPVNIDLAAYCVEFLKLPPGANQIFKLAPAPIQKKYEAMSKVLRSAYRIQHAGLLQPDSNPAAYTDSIKQWAVWAVEQKFNQSRFTEAFIGHTKKNVEAAGQQWPKQAEEMIRKVSPGRWRDITRILQGAGLPVPQ